MPTVSPTKALRLARNIAYPQQLWWFIASFIGLVSLLHFTNFLVLRYQKYLLAHKNGNDDPENSQRKTTQRFSFRKLTSTVSETIAIVLYRYTIPLGYSHRVNVTEIAIVVAYITSVLIWTFINCYNSDTGLKFDPLFYANRAGNIATSQIPLLVLLSGKNNLLSLISGVSFEKLHIFHRAVGRALLILALIHTGGRLKLGLAEDEASTAWLQVGYATLAGWIILLFMFIRPIRASSYYSLHTNPRHYVLSLPALFFWGFDRFLRVVRTVWNNRGLSPTQIKGEIVSPNMIRLSIHQWMTWKAGQAVYITIPKISMMPFEAHPFTMANIPTAEKNKPNELVFLIKVKNGFTKRLYHSILEAQDKNEEFRFNAFIDGPYGSPPPDLDTFSDVVIITGGSGLSFGLPLLQEVVKIHIYTNTNDQTASITEALWNNGEKDISPGSKHTTPTPEAADAEKLPTINTTTSGIIINPGRLDIKSLLEEELSSASTDEISVNGVYKYSY
ncbi:hypothetical protein Clacol_002948 [Clathrus columnatus]|uniref:ferric-chelate reductase (NADPH) n=1 Tax=Clathrus columnatus TaxID=1419009 RepID=A0AAV5A263_9AGAM|nr:hypothetical protein Clacol_002948 [Clathrus columnatus]